MKQVIYGNMQMKMVLLRDVSSVDRQSVRLYVI